MPSCRTSQRKISSTGRCWPAGRAYSDGDGDQSGPTLHPKPARNRAKAFARLCRTTIAGSTASHAAWAPLNKSGTLLVECPRFLRPLLPLLKSRVLRRRKSPATAQGTMMVSSNIADVQRGASETGSASTQVLSAAQSLSADSNRLKLEVGKFLNAVRAA